MRLVELVEFIKVQTGERADSPVWVNANQITHLRAAYHGGTAIFLSNGGSVWTLSIAQSPSEVISRLTA
jgi:hypothetical protein